MACGKLSLRGISSLISRKGPFDVFLVMMTFLPPFVPIVFLVGNLALPTLGLKLILLLGTLLASGCEEGWWVG